MTFIIKILGAGSATPLKGRHQSSQLISINEHKYLMDCGEGTQYRLIEDKQNLNKIETIFISHLHGDHYFGLIGLISTMSLLGRQSDLQVFAPSGLRELITLNLKLSGTILNFNLSVNEVNVSTKELVYEDPLVSVYSFPLKHGVTTFGYLFEEKPRQLKLVKEKMPVEMLVEEMVMLKNGQDVPDVENKIKYSVKEFTYPPLPQIRYAYCSDTVFDPGIAAYIENVDLLYHEATYLDNLKDKAIRNRHSTAAEAATIAKMAGVKKLMIGHLSSRYDAYDLHLEESSAIFENTIPALEGKSITLI